MRHTVFCILVLSFLSGSLFAQTPIDATSWYNANKQKYTIYYSTRYFVKYAHDSDDPNFASLGEKSWYYTGVSNLADLSTLSLSRMLKVGTANTVYPMYVGWYQINNNYLSTSGQPLKPDGSCVDVLISHNYRTYRIRMPVTDHGIRTLLPTYLSRQCHVYSAVTLQSGFVKRGNG